MSFRLLCGAWEKVDHKEVIADRSWSGKLSRLYIPVSLPPLSTEQRDSPFAALH